MKQAQSRSTPYRSISRTWPGQPGNNLAVFGLAGAESAPGHIVATPIEHPAIAEPLARLEAASFTINNVPVDDQGMADVPQMTGN